MSTHDEIKSLWMQTRDRLLAKGLLSGDGASLSLRCPGGSTMIVGSVEAAEPELRDWRKVPAEDTAAVHARVYACRTDVGAIAWGGGPLGTCLKDFGGLLPQVFDEQARHLGPMAPAITQYAEIEGTLRKGGNVLIWRDLPLCLGMTYTRLALNAELFEKCAKAYVLAVATGGRVKRLPWLVRYIANSRLYKDERRATEAFARGEFPVEARGY
jgi:hypothetical protein